MTLNHWNSLSFHDVRMSLLLIYFSSQWYHHDDHFDFSPDPNFTLMSVKCFDQSVLFSSLVEVDTKQCSTSMVRRWFHCFYVSNRSWNKLKMLIYEIFSHPDRFQHRAHLISGASVAILLCTILTYLSPFLLTYYTGEFWKRESIYSEQPRVNNTLKYLFIVNNNDLTFFGSKI